LVEQCGEAFVVPHRVGFEERECGAEGNGLADGGEGLYALAMGEWGYLPDLFGVVGIEQGCGFGPQVGTAHQLAAEREKRDPDAAGEVALEHRVPGFRWTPNISRKMGGCKGWAVGL
jgi:hypothetical protein